MVYFLNLNIMSPSLSIGSWPLGPLNRISSKGQQLHLFLNIGWLQDEPRAARMDVNGEEACRAASPCLHGWTEALHTDSTSHTPLQAAHIEMRYLDLGQNMHFAFYCD